MQKIIEFSYAENIHQVVSMAPIDIEVGCRAVTTGKLVSPRLSNNASCRHAGSAHVGSRRRSSRAWGGGERDHQPQRSDAATTSTPAISVGKSGRTGQSIARRSPRGGRRRHCRSGSDCAAASYPRAAQAKSRAARRLRKAAARSRQFRGALETQQSSRQRRKGA